MHVIIEGPDGVGKTTLANYIRDKYDIELTNEGKYRRTFSNGKYIDYDVDPNLIEITKASYSFPDEVEKGFSR